MVKLSGSATFIPTLPLVLSITCTVFVLFEPSGNIPLSSKIDKLLILNVPLPFTIFNLSEPRVSPKDTSIVKLELFSDQKSLKV